MHALSRKGKIRRNSISEKKDGMKNIIKNKLLYFFIPNVHIIFVLKYKVRKGEMQTMNKLECSRFLHDKKGKFNY